MQKGTPYECHLYAFCPLNARISAFLCLMPIETHNAKKIFMKIKKEKKKKKESLNQ
jgi:hypothetical protein